MNKDTLIILAAAAAGLFAVYKMTSKASTSSASTKSTYDSTVKQIYDANGNPYGNGWTYYTNGVSIGPDGSYYLGDTKVWSPTA